MDYRPIDQATREAIRTALDRNFFVEAGAGTGKTTVLVDRIVAILRDGHATVDELVVITFTRLAAAELATRVRERLEDARDNATSEEERARLEEALYALPRARIETIHAFAAGLLRERPVEAGLDPGFEEMDDLSASLAFDEAYHEWLAGLLNPEDGERPEAVWRALNRGLDLRHLREVVEQVHHHRSLLPLVHDDVPAPDIAGFLERFEQDVDELEDLLRGCRNPDDPGAQQIRVLIAQRDDLRAMRHDPDALERAVLLLPKIGKKGTRTNWADPADCDRQKEICEELSEAVEEIKRALRAEAIAGLLPLAEEFVRDYTEQRRRTGRAEFEDLLIWARDLLRDRPEVRRYFRERFRCILVDEFQDTDPLQVEILLYLCGEEPDGTAARDWRELRPAPGRLFLVGDPKQSIYRFRRADISIYEWVKRHVLPGDLCTITQNFRSLSGVIDWVNGCFQHIIAPLDGVQAGYVPLAPWPQARLDLPRAPVVVVHHEMDGSADDVRRQEATTLAALLRQAVEVEAWPVRDPETGEVRPARWRDIAILVPSRTGIEIYEEALAEAGIPYRHEGGRSFFQRQEVRELINCLRAIDDPGDRLSMVAALRSGAFGCSDEEIFLAANAMGADFDYRREPPPGHAAVADGMHALRTLHTLRHRLPLPELVRRVIDATRLIEYALTLPQGDQAAANLLKVVDQARAFAAARGGGLRAFVRWLDTATSRSTEEEDADVAEAGDDVVRLLTIHAAKGLEFPIVALANLQGRDARVNNVIPDHAAHRLHLRVGSQSLGYFETPGYAAAAEIEQQHAAAERDRLLYVAATRARDHLILPVILGKNAREKERKPKGMLARLVPHLPAPPPDPSPNGSDIDGCHVLLAAHLQVGDNGFRESSPPAAAVGVDAALVARERWVAERAALLERAGAGLRVTTASSVEAWDQEPADNAEATQGALPREATLAVGTALHATMEALDLTGDGEVESMARAKAAEAGVPGHADEVAALARACLASGVVQRARAAERAAREVAFTLPVGDGFVEGRVDLLFREPDGLVIADYKTDRVTPEQVDARLAVYRNQAAVYAFAVAEATGLPVKEVVFVFARAGVERAIPVDDGLLALGRNLATASATLTDAAVAAGCA